MLHDKPRVLEDILEGLFHVALADGRYHEGEEELLNAVGRSFGVTPEAFDAIEALASGGAARVLMGRALPGTPRRSCRPRGRAGGIPVRAHHPDKMIARGLPAETVNLGNARLAQINLAWEEVSARLREVRPSAEPATTSFSSKKFA